jgi:oxygen-independent coproporphyrinogen-3 oxidase
MRELSIYVHVPFCVKKCLYCDFLSFGGQDKSQNEYFKALATEISVSSKAYKDYVVKSVFFGGGTPSFVDEKLLCGGLQAIFDNFTVDKEAEISLEVNPASAIYEKLAAYKKAGFNRISIGAQSLNDSELKLIGRAHDSKAFYETFENAKKAGFDNINVDVMSALPGQSLESYMSTLEKVVKLKPTHISAYSLIIEEGTPFYDMELELPDEDTDRLMYHETKRYLAENGYHRYEISNYAKDGSSKKGDPEGYECFHNKVYWTRGNYLGLGLGASSMVENVRWSNTRDLDEYCKALAGSSESGLQSIRTDIETLSLNSQMEEYMFLGLRLVKGVSVSGFEKAFGKNMYEVYGDVIIKYTEPGLLERDGDMLRLTDAGLDVSNTVMADLLLE